jgi:hypothetical protein
MNTIVGYRMGLSCGMAAYAKGAVLAEVVEAADDRMYREKLRKNATA